MFFNGTGTVAISVSYNVFSITDHAVGDYSANTTSFSTSNFVVAGLSKFGGTPCVVGANTDTTTATTSTFRIYTVNFSNTPVDSSRVSLVFYGDQ